MKLFRVVFFESVAAIFIMSGCKGGAMHNSGVQKIDLNAVPDRAWEELSRKKIYFGHQSVGSNILDGVQEIIEGNTKIQLNILELDHLSSDTLGCLIHSPVGENFKPLSKIAGFQQMVESNFKDSIDIAMFKFCYVDVTSETSVDGLFNDYKSALSELKAKFPKILFVHSTVPLVQQQKTWKSAIKEIIGTKEIWEYKDNVARNEYNELLRKEYEGKEPIFDIAQYESTAMDGKRQIFKVAGKTYYAMEPVYTTDGGHLNETGKKYLGAAFLKTLVDAIH